MVLSVNSMVEGELGVKIILFVLNEGNYNISSWSFEGVPNVLKLSCLFVSLFSSCK